MPYKTKLSGIYKIQSISHPERIYIGSAVNIFHRWSIHRLHFAQQKHSSPQFQNHYNKHGLDDLVFSIVATCDRKDLIPEKTPFGKIIWIEQCFIWAYKYKGSNRPFFNASSTAGSPLGTKHSKEYGENISKRQKGIKRPDRIIPVEEHELRSAALVGNTRGMGNKGKKRSDESKEKMRQKKLGSKMPQKTRDAILKGIKARAERLRIEKEELHKNDIPVIKVHGNKGRKRTEEAINNWRKSYHSKPIIISEETKRKRLETKRKNLALKQ